MENRSYFPLWLNIFRHLLSIFPKKYANMRCFWFRPFRPQYFAEIRNGIYISFRRNFRFVEKSSCKWQCSAFSTTRSLRLLAKRAAGRWNAKLSPLPCPSMIYAVERKWRHSYTNDTTGAPDHDADVVVGSGGAVSDRIGVAPARWWS